MTIYRTIAARLFAAVALILALALTATPAQAQATRTWVSGVGDDVNPCSRTAPCKTFAGAISKTAAGGEINCLDPGGFGAVTITKSITIDCEDTQGSILGSNTNGVNVNDSASGFANTIRVVLRGLSINGAGSGVQNAQGNPGSGLVGVNFTSGASLTLEKCIVQNFNAGTAAGVRFAPAGAGRLTLTDVTLVSNGTGILVQPSGANGSSRVMLTNVRVINNTTAGLSVNTTGATSATGSRVVIDGGTFAGNLGNGIVVLSPAGTQGAIATVRNASVVNNSSNGLRSDGAGALLLVGNTAIQNNGTGLSAVNGGGMLTNGDNAVNVNGTDGAFTGPAAKS